MNSKTNHFSKTSIVVLNFDGGIDSRCCLDSIEEFAQGAEVIVSQNSEISVEASKATRDYLMFLNADTVIRHDTVELLVKELESRNTECMICPQIEGEQRIRPGISGYSQPPLFLRRKDFGRIREFQNKSLVYESSDAKITWLPTSPAPSLFQKFKARIRKQVARYIVAKKSRCLRLKISPKRVLFIRSDHLGDVLLSLPTIELFKEHFPTAKIYFMGSPQWKTLVLASNLVDEYIIYERSRRLRLCAFRKFKFDLSIELGQRNTLTDSILLWAARVSYRLGYHTSYTGLFYTHPLRWDGRVRRLEFEQVARVLRRIGIRGKPRRLDLCTQLKNINSIRNSLPKSYIVMHPYSNYKSNSGLNQWPVDRFIELANRFIHEGKNIVLVGTKDENEGFQKVASGIDKKVINLMGQTDLLQLSDVLKFSDLVIANNSGVYHLATALNCSCVLINGPTNFRRWGPIDSNTRLLCRKNLACVGMDCVQCRRGDHACMRGIKTDEVYSAACQFL